jgi:hypothetical protein
MPRVNDEYVRGVNAKLKTIELELADISVGTDPHSTTWSDPPPLPLSNMTVKAGSQNYTIGWNLSGRVRWQGEGLNAAFSKEQTFIDTFYRNVGVFLDATDETELENISAQEFQGYLPPT